MTALERFPKYRAVLTALEELDNIDLDALYSPNPEKRDAALKVARKGIRYAIEELNKVVAPVHRRPAKEAADAD